MHADNAPANSRVPSRPDGFPAKGYAWYFESPLARESSEPSNARLTELEAHIRRRHAVTDGTRGWEADFPMREEMEDHAGRTRSFIIECYEAGFGFTVRAREQTTRQPGYEFAAYSETSPYNALGRLRQKMYRGIATRHLTGQPGAYHMLHDTLRGHITSDGHGGAVLVVDGLAVGMENLASMLVTHEGWGFELRIVDALE